jgi:NAD+ kinase
VSVGEVHAALEQTLRGDYSIERRMMLRVSILGVNGKPRATLFGLNDAVLHEGGQGIIELAMSIGDTLVGRFKADGVIVATPTGSTAYSLSAGGPILEPLQDVLIATPICPHSLAIRPLIFPAYDSIRIGWSGKGGHALLVVDGQVTLELHPGEAIVAGRAEKGSCFVQLRQRSFWEVLREKLKWGA